MADKQQLFSKFSAFSLKLDLEYASGCGRKLRVLDEIKPLMVPHL